MRLVDNRDVCAEIMRYFNVSLTVDKTDNIRTKRGVLLSLALANRALNDIALDALWNSMTTLEPIVQIFNSSLTSNGTSTDKMLCYNNAGDYWEIRISRNNHTVGPVHRVLSHLSRIRHLYFATFPSRREYSLWQALSSFEWLNTLCPNLQNLSLGVDVNTPQTAYYMIPLVSPILRNISLHSLTLEGSGEMAASIVLDILKCRNVGVASISYKGFTSSRIVQRIVEFPNLQSAVIQTPRHATGDRVTSEQITRFPGLTNLTSLDVHLGLFDTPQSVGSWIEKLISLGSLTIRGSLQTILRCLAGRTPILSIHSFALYLDAAGLPRNQRHFGPLIQNISDMFPSLQTLHLVVETHDHITPLSVTQMLALRERRMRTLVLRRCLAINSSEDLVDIITVWPTLQNVHIESERGQGDASVVLPYISRHAPHLYDATLPVDFSPLTVATRHLSSDSGMCSCPLQRLSFSYLPGTPLNITKTLTLARNLVTLFPRLSVVTTSGSDEPSTLNDVQTAIATFQELLASPPKRSDHLFQQH